MNAYRFNKAACTDPMTGIIHAFAITAAMANRWPYSFIQEVGK